MLDFKTCAVHFCASLPDPSSLLVKYDSGGNKAWEARLDSAVVNAIAIDPSGRVIVAGPSVPEDTAADLQTEVFDSSGIRLWKATFDAGVQANAPD